MRAPDHVFELQRSEGGWRPAGSVAFVTDDLDYERTRWPGGMKPAYACQQNPHPNGSFPATRTSGPEIDPLGSVTLPSQ